MLDNITYSLEEDSADGSYNKEIEHVFYARITDFKQLEKAQSKVRQEQWEIKLPLTKDNAAKGSVRVRSIKEKGKETEYILTSKMSLNETGDKMEVSLPTTAEQFVQFKFLASQGMIKDRYTFDAGDGLKWEVDVFIDQDGGYYQWCKIDFEVPSHDIKVPAFPIEIYETIDATNLERDSAQDKKVQALYDQYFLTKNVFKKKASTELTREINKISPNKVQDEVILD